MDQSDKFSNSSFVLCALASGLVSHSQIEAARAEVERVVSLDELDVEAFDQRIAEELVNAEWLNPWQVIQLREGRTKFTLGPYRILDSIGRGGMGQVFKAEHPILGREVAVKVLPRDKSTPEAVANFNREMKTLARLDHPNLVRAHDAGEDGNVHYLVTEYVAGNDLRRMVRGQGPLDMQTAARVISQVAAGLQHAHEQGLVHRDVKPGNVLVTEDGTAKLSDLGLAGPLEGDIESDPRFGKIAGTADYLSPDHIRMPFAPKPAWDIYSLGCTLYYAVTGKVPFPKGTTREKVKAHCERQPIDPRRLNRALDESFVEVIADMMAKDPAERLQAAKDVMTRLRPWVPAEESIPAPPVTIDQRLGGGGQPFTLADTQANFPEPQGSTGQISQTTDRMAAAGAETHWPVEMDEPDGKPLALLGPLILFVAVPLGLMGLLAIAWSVFVAIQ